MSASDSPPIYDVQFSEPAEADLEVVVLRIARFSVEAAEAWQTRFLDAFASLSQLPRRCLPAPESVPREQDVRQLLVRHNKTTYRVLFSVFDATDDSPAVVRILGICPGAQGASQPPEGQ